MNVAAPLLQLSQSQADQVAVYAPRKRWFTPLTYDHLTFRELEERSHFYGHYLLERGLQRGDRVLLFIKPCVDFSAITFALFRAGLVPIFIDPGMGKTMLLQAIDHIKPQAMIAEPQVMILKMLYRHAFRHLNISLNVSTLKRLARRSSPSSYQHRPLMIEPGEQEEAAVLFTSGGTGTPKGVLYTHGIFTEQRQTLQKMFNLTNQDIDLPGFPLFALFTITMGMTSVIPSMNPAKPAQVNPAHVVRNIRDHRPTFIAGSPAIWQRVGDYCQRQGITLDSVKYLVMFGAPVSTELHQLWRPLLPQGDTYTPYGATECLPVSCISGRELDQHKQTLMTTGAGTCVGAPCPGVTVKIAPISDDIMASEREVSWLGVGAVGEVCVASSMVTPSYVGMPEQTASAKIMEGGRVKWHRMGDLGYLDQDHQLWFCGRKAHRLTLGQQVTPVVPTENIVNNLTQVRRSALVQIEDQPYLIVQRQDFRLLTGTEKKRENLAIEQHLAAHSPLKLQDIFYIKEFPVDVRHNIKINRQQLARDFASKRTSL